MGGGRYRLLQPDLTSEDLEREASAYRNRGERDRDRQQRMVEYAEGRSCRWKRILDYFDSDEELAEGRCGNCDSCRTAGVNPPAGGAATSEVAA